MPLVRPFRGLGYALDRYAAPAPAGMRIADLTEVVCPPYDVITPAERAEGRHRGSVPVPRQTPASPA